MSGENEGLSPNELAAIEGEDETQTDDLLEAVAGEEEEVSTGAVDEVAVATGAEVSTATAAATPNAEVPAVAAAELNLTLADGDVLEVPANIPAVRFQFRDDGKVLPQFAEQFAEMDAKYETGQLPLAQYNEQRDVLRAEMGNVKAAEQLWAAECDTFWKYNPNWKPGSPLFDILNGEIKRLAAQSQEQGLSGIETIYAAQARVIKAIDAVRTPGAAPTTTTTATPTRPASPRPAAATHALAAMPAAAAAETGKGEFAHLDNLTGLDLERAVAGLSPEQRERWAQES